MEIERTNLDHDVTLIFKQDDSPDSPRNWDNCGVMCCWHPDYNLGDEQFTRSDHDSMEDVVTYLRDERDAVEILPLFLLDHSGITIRTGAPVVGHPKDNDFSRQNRFVGDGAGWDTTMVGFIFMPADKANEVPDVRACLEAEVETYDQYLTGDVYGYEIEDTQTGEHLDSCWGFFGFEDFKSEANDAAQHHVKERAVIAARNDLALTGWRY